MNNKMNNKEKFENFLESLKGHGHDVLIESVKKGFTVCYESELVADKYGPEYGVEGEEDSLRKEPFTYDEEKNITDTNSKIARENQRKKSIPMARKKYLDSKQAKGISDEEINKNRDNLTNK